MYAIQKHSDRTRLSETDSTEFVHFALCVAEGAARDAGSYLMSLSDRSKVIRGKSSRDYVLQGDIESENIILDRLRQHFPHHHILSEERGQILGESFFQWVVDPLDGSFNFQHGDSNFGIVIGLLIDGVPVLSTIYVPARDELFSAIKGNGATCNGIRIQVSHIGELLNSRIHFGDFSKDDEGTSNIMRLEDMKRLSSSVGRIRMVGSAAIDHTNIAAGIADALVVRDIEGKWDLIPGTLLVHEAGGETSVLESNDSTLFLLTNGLLHKKLGTLLQ